jgi:hypothetical protein
MSAPMTIVTVPITPVGSDGCTGYRTNSCASTATYDAPNDSTA